MGVAGTKEWHHSLMRKYRCQHLEPVGGRDTGGRDVGGRDTGGRSSVVTGTREAGTWRAGTVHSHGIHERPNQRDYVHPSWLSLVPLPLLLHFRICGLWWVRMCGNFFLPHNEPGGESTVSVIFTLTLFSREKKLQYKYSLEKFLVKTLFSQLT